MIAVFMVDAVVFWYGIEKNRYDNFSNYTHQKFFIHDFRLFADYLRIVFIRGNIKYLTLTYRLYIIRFKIVRDADNSLSPQDQGCRFSE